MVVKQAIIISVLIYSIACCDIYWSCEKCTESKCTYVVKGSEGFCVSDRNEVLGKKRIFTLPTLCKFAANYKMKPVADKKEVVDESLYEEYHKKKLNLVTTTTAQPHISPISGTPPPPSRSSSAPAALVIIDMSPLPPVVHTHGQSRNLQIPFPPRETPPAFSDAAKFQISVPKHNHPVTMTTKSTTTAAPQQRWWMERRKVLSASPSIPTNPTTSTPKYASAGFKNWLKSANSANTTQRQTSGERRVKLNATSTTVEKTAKPKLELGNGASAVTLLSTTAKIQVFGLGNPKTLSASTQVATLGPTTNKPSQQKWQTTQKVSNSSGTSGYTKALTFPSKTMETISNNSTTPSTTSATTTTTRKNLGLGHRESGNHTLVITEVEKTSTSFKLVGGSVPPSNNNSMESPYNGTTKLTTTTVAPSFLSTAAPSYNETLFLIPPSSSTTKIGYSSTTVSPSTPPPPSSSTSPPPSSSTSPPPFSTTSPPPFSTTSPPPSSTTSPPPKISIFKIEKSAITTPVPSKISAYLFQTTLFPSTQPTLPSIPFSITGPPSTTTVSPATISTTQTLISPNITIKNTTVLPKPKELTMMVALESSQPQISHPTVKSTHSKKSQLNSTTHKSKYPRDAAYHLSDEKEIFTQLKLSYECDAFKGNATHTLMLQYSSSLCSIAKVAMQNANDTLDEVTFAWLLQNPARRHPSTCSAIRYIRKKCRVSAQRKVRQLYTGLHNGPTSSLFSRIITLHMCDKNETRENGLDRLSRISCYAGETFLELNKYYKLNNYDLGFSMSNPAFRFPRKCHTLFFKKRNCFNKKQ